jgi:transcription elongation factor GreA
MKNIRMLKKTYEKLHLEKKVLESELPNIINEVNLAREKGDLRENAEYTSAKATKIDIEHRISLITTKLLKASIINEIILKDFVTFGVTVNLKDLKTGKKYTYTILGEEEANISENIISCDSILGENLLGKKKNDEFIFETPSGEREFFVEDLFINSNI